MPERSGQILKIACLLLAALLVYKATGLALRAGSLARVAIPALPTLASDTNAPAADSGATNAPGGLVTNTLPSTTVTNAGTNLISSPTSEAGATNVATGKTSAASPTSTEHETATVAAHSTSKVDVPTASTNASLRSIASNAVVMTGSNSLAGASATNYQASTSLSTNGSGMATNSTSNVLDKATSGRKGTNAMPPGATAMAGSRMPPGVPGMPGKPPHPLPPEIKARVNRIYESQLLGQIIRVPLSLLGIAGDFAIIRTPTGLTGLVKEGDSLGEIKLLRIGINRVLIQQDEQKQELMIFNGFGGTSLLTNENTTAK